MAVHLPFLPAMMVEWSFPMLIVLRQGDGPRHRPPLRANL